MPLGLVPFIIYLGKWNKYRIMESLMPSSVDTVLGIIYQGKWNKYRIMESLMPSSVDTVLGWEEEIPFFTEKADI